MKLTFTIELNGRQKQQWERYKRLHLFLNVPDSLLATALIHHGLRTYMVQHWQNQSHKKTKS